MSEDCLNLFFRWLQRQPLQKITQTSKKQGSISFLCICEHLDGGCPTAIAVCLYSSSRCLWVHNCFCQRGFVHYLDKVWFPSFFFIQISHIFSLATQKLKKSLLKRNGKKSHMEFWESCFERMLSILTYNFSHISKNVISANLYLHLILLWYCTPLNDKKYKLMLVIALLKSTKVAKPMINFYPSIYL